ncbi:MULTISPECIES: hypothetical protein [unclassified Microbacterium]|uniref:hypothetical protein n=1 Tax=unclassified Microbacterium TaxID=2609290 RepID=UPI000AC38917|nr:MULTISPECIES: hypothetical protein [unclassified Microbacterium]MBN9215306.1 hypothetical protein [Microbacterium sp.]
MTAFAGAKTISRFGQGALLLAAALVAAIELITLVGAEDDGADELDEDAEY